MNIKIFVSHRIDKKARIIDNNLYENIKCGSYFDNSKDDLLRDDVGDNISEKRLSYCELTVQYWAWKNVDADYYGLCHYRRYLSFSELSFPENSAGVIERDFIDDNAINTFHLDSKTMTSEISKYDIITNKGIPTKQSGDYSSVLDYIKKNSYSYNIEDYYVLRSIIEEKCPNYIDDFDNFFNGDTNRWYNCYIMSKKLFYEYNTWLFDILFEFEKRIDISLYTQEMLRVFGVYAERLWGVFLLHLQRITPDIKICEKQLVYFTKPEDSQNIIIPKANNKEINIVIPFTAKNKDDYTVTLNSLYSNLLNDKKINIYTIYSPEDKCVLDSFRIIKENKSNIREYCLDFGKEISFLQQSIESVFDNKEILLFFSIFDYFSRFLDKIILLKPGTVILRDLTGLYNVNLDDCYAAAPYDYISIIKCNTGEFPKCYMEKTLRIGDNLYLNYAISILNLKNISTDYISAYFLKTLFYDSFLNPINDVFNMVFHGKTITLDLNWCIIPDLATKQLRENLRWYVPYKYIENYEDAYNNPYALSFLFKPDIYNSVDYSECYWNYKGTVKGMNQDLNGRFDLLEHYCRLLEQRVSISEYKIRRFERIFLISLLRKIKKLVCKK